VNKRNKQNSKRWRASAYGVAFLLMMMAGCDNSSPVSSNNDNDASEPAVIDKVIITPESASLGVGETQQFTATVYDQRGDVMEGETINWSSDDEGVIKVNASGLATSMDEGTALISANAGTVSHAANVTVSNPVQSGSWQPVGSGVNGDVQAFTKFGGDLIAGGRFTTADGQTAIRVARWDGSEWHSIGSIGESVEDPNTSQEAIRALTVFNGDLIAGGWFSRADGQTVNNIARWDGTNWQSMNDGVDHAVLGLTVFEDDLIAVGMFSNTGGGEKAQYVVRWNGTKWEPMATGMNGGVVAVQVFGGELIIGGGFRRIGGLVATRVARWDGSEWQPMGTAGDPDDLNESVNVLTVFDNELIVGGRFASADGREVNNVARWDGSGWQPLETGTSNEVQALTSFDGDLIVGGDFNTASGVEVRRTARWNGSRWQNMGSGIGSPHSGLASVDAFIVFDGDLFVGGYFKATGSGQTANNIARWKKP